MNGSIPFWLALGYSFSFIIFFFSLISQLGGNSISRPQTLFCKLLFYICKTRTDETVGQVNSPVYSGMWEETPVIHKGHLIQFFHLTDIFKWTCLLKFCSIYKQSGTAGVSALTLHCSGCWKICFVLLHSRRYPFYSLSSPCLPCPPFSSVKASSVVTVPVPFFTQGVNQLPVVGTMLTHN